MAINPKIFKAYDARALYPSEINEEAARAVARAFCFLLKPKRIVIGRDARKSSESLQNAMTDTFTSMGVDVCDLGAVPTPLVLYAVAKKGFGGGIIVSASHSTSEYAGIKLIKHPNLQMCIPGDMEKIKQLALNPVMSNESEANKIQEKKGRIEKINILQEYVDELCQKFQGVKNLKVVVDYGNGMGSITASPVFKKLSLEIIPMYQEIDMSFPNHTANPMDVSTLEEIRKKVVDEKADLGVAFDGDADRAICIDDTGEIIYADIMMALLIPFELKGRSEKKVYYDIRSSRAVQDAIKENNAKGIMLRAGNPFYKIKLTEEGGVFGGEVTGHMFFQDHYNIDDGLYVAMKVMNAMSQDKKKLSEHVKSLMKYFPSHELRFKVENADEIIERVKTQFLDGEVNTIDGVRVDYPDWWFSLRKSNTEPVLKLMIEANSKQKLDEMQEKLTGMIKQSGLIKE